MTAEAAGLFIGVISPSSDFALALLPTIIALHIVFDGKNASLENTPMFLRWMPKSSLVKWAFEALSMNEFVGLTFNEPNVSDELSHDSHATLPHFASKATLEVSLTSFFSSVLANVLHPLCKKVDLSNH